MDDEYCYILVQHSGFWTEKHIYQNFHVEALPIRSSSNFLEFHNTIRQIPLLSVANGLLDIKYSVKEGIPPITVYNDMGVAVYFGLKKKKSDITDYPLCVSFDVNDLITTSSTTNVATGSASVIPVEQYTEEVADSIQFCEDATAISTLVSEDEIIFNPFHQTIAIGQIFAEKEILSTVVKRYAIHKKFQFKVHKSCSKRYCLGCVDDQCHWNLKAYSIGQTKLFRVTSLYDEHNCGIDKRFGEQRQATSVIVGGLIKDKLTDPKTVYTPADIKRDMKKDFSVELNYMKAWRSKEKALEILRGKPREAYQKLPSYLYMLQHTNPGSVVKLQTTPEGRFLYTFVALNASIEGWVYCRPTVVVDGSHLNSPYNGTYIIACTQDAAGHILPLAYAVVDSENDASWEWFFSCFREAFGEREGMCIVSDRHDSIIRAVPIVYPTVPHCFCMFHLWNNIKTKFKKATKQISKVYFAAARAYTIPEFTKQIDNIGGVDYRVKQYLATVGYNKWSRAYCTANRTFNMTSNIAESVNSKARHSKGLPVVHFLDSMMHIVQEWNNNNGEEAMGTFRELTDKYEELLTASTIASQSMTVIPSRDFKHEVVAAGEKHVVSIPEKKCTCGRFQMEDIPCSHVLAVLDRLHVSAYKYCSEFYTTKNFRKTYEIPVCPIPGEATWQIPQEVLAHTVLPPRGRSKRGRPTKTRFKSSWERPATRNKNHCGQCGQKGHNRKTCKNIPQD